MLSIAELSPSLFLSFVIADLPIGQLILVCSILSNYLKRTTFFNLPWKYFLLLILLSLSSIDSSENDQDYIALSLQQALKVMIIFILLAFLRSKDAR